MKVYVVFHADIESDRYVRGVYATKEAAEVGVSTTEWNDNWIIEWAAKARIARGDTPDGFKPERIETWTWEGETRQATREAVWNFRYAREHSDACCGVDEWEVE